MSAYQLQPAGSREFMEYLNRTRIDWLKIVDILGFTLIPLFIILDYIIVPGELFSGFVYNRAAVSVLLISQYFVLRFVPRYAPLHGMFTSLVVGTMISVMTVQLGGFNSAYYAGLNLVMMAVVILIPWGFAYAILNSMIIIGMYFGLNALTLQPFDWKTLINNSYFLFSTGFIAVSVSQIRFVLLQKEFNANANLVIAKREQDTIMNAVEEGLFIIQLVDGKYHIGNQQSEAINRIFGDERFSDRPFSEVMARYFPAKKIEELNEYLKMIATRDVEDDMIRDLNPLEKEETLQIDSERNKRVVEFEFKRIEQRRGDKDFLISVKDVTRQVEMEKLIEMNRIQAENESQMMLAILQQGPAMLADFIEGVELEISAIESTIREGFQEKEKDSFQKAIETIFRAAHSMKGNAALLDLKFFAEELNLFEEKIAQVRDSEESESEKVSEVESFLEDLERIKKTYQRIQELIRRIQQFQGKKSEANSANSALEALPSAIEELAQRVASETGKKVKMNTATVDFTGIAGSSAYFFRDILVQLTRNSISHGIEKPGVRVEAGKPEFGTITLNMQPEGEKYVIEFRDDGSSFNFDAIRSKAVELGKINEENRDEWNEKKLIKLIFDSGFSTSGETNIHAGRGVGMDIIKQRIKNMGGDLKVNYKTGEFTAFKIIFPLETLGGQRESAEHRYK